MKLLSAFRAKRDFCCLKEGEVFNLQRFSTVCDLDPSISRKVLYELFCAACGEDTALEVNYSDSDEFRQPGDKVDGVIWIDLMKSDSPQLIIRGRIIKKAPKWCQDLIEAANKNDRLRISKLFSTGREPFYVAVFVNEPGVGCVSEVRYERCPQFISASSNTDLYNWAVGHFIVPGLHATVSRCFIRRLKDYNKLKSPLSGRLNGFVVKMSVTGDSPFPSERLAGTWTLYRGPGGCWVSDPGSAFIYSSEKEAVKAEPDIITSHQPLYRLRVGASSCYLRLDLNQAITSTVIDTQQWRSEMFGMSDGINYYAEAVKEESI